MNSRELVTKTIKGENPGRTPVYGWVEANLGERISAEFGSVSSFEDYYEYDLAHIFGGPSPYPKEISDLKEKGVEVTPEALLSYPMNSPDNMGDYADIIEKLKFHQSRDRFCYMQTNGIFECLNGPFGIENHLAYLAEYPGQLKEAYSRQADWSRRFALNVLELGMDMAHISDDWGAQKSLMFSPAMWREMIYPCHKLIVDSVKAAGGFVSLHSDGCNLQVTDGIAELGYDLFHPWQESAGMSYDLYLQKYRHSFAIMGGLCIQTLLGFGDYGRLEREIKRVFGLLKGERWVCCTTHYVQEHCSIDELKFAYDLVVKLARG